MKKLLCFVALFIVTALQAQDDCDIELMIAPVEQGETLPQSVENQLQAKLMNALSTNGLTVGKDYSQFFIAARLDHSYTEAVPGPPAQVAIHTTLTLYIGDVKNQKIFVSEGFELRGVGRSEERALTNALSRINARNNALSEFAEKGKTQIIDHFNNHYEAYLDKARQADSKGNTDEALYYATLIPACCSGYAAAKQLAENIWQKHNAKQHEKTAQPKSAKEVGRAWNVKQKRVKIKIDLVKYK